MVADLRFELLENGLDFIASGLDYIARGETKSDLKYGVLHIASGVELVLKERLRQEDWRLLFPKPEKADEALYKAGDFYSVGQEVCLARLEEECGIEITDTNKDKLKTFRSRRNRIEHFSILDSKSAIESLAAQALWVLLEFIGEAFDDATLSDEEKQLLARIRERLSEFEAFSQTRLAEIFPATAVNQEEWDRLIECPCCLKPTLRCDLTVACMFCGYRETSEDAAEFYIAQHVEAGPRFSCPECDSNTLVHLEVSGSANPAIEFVCFGCGSRWNDGVMEVCPMCQEVEHSAYMTHVGCRECFNGYVASDHT